jgi:hypothetical protein
MAGVAHDARVGEDVEALGHRLAREHEALTA